MRYCSDVLEKFHVKDSCCESCHWDSENGYFELIDYEIGEEKYLLCCGKGLAAEKMGLTA